MEYTLTTPFFDDRPEDIRIDTIVIHSMHAMPESLRYSIAHCHQALLSHKVSCHFYIGRQGEIYPSVDAEKRAWHAGVSQMPFADDTRKTVNDFSIGIELIGHPDDDFSEDQYKNLVILIQNISSKHPISAIVGHDQIAPGRKVDPGTRFDWSLLKTQLNRPLRMVF